MSIHQLALLLSRQLKQVVIDNTRLTGSYDVNLEWTLDDPAHPEAAADTAGAPGIFKAIQQQLGLTLEPSKAPVEILVVDRAEQVPTRN